MGGTWTVHGVAGPSLPLPVSDSLVDGFNWHFSNRAIQPPSPTVVVKSYRADVFTIRCCSFLFLNLFRAEKEVLQLQRNHARDLPVPRPGEPPTPQGAPLLCTPKSPGQ